jgi:hypothetical protein
LELSDAVDVPPQPAATSASEQSVRRMDRFMENAPFAADSARCLTRGQYSSDSLTACCSMRVQADSGHALNLGLGAV